MSSYRKRPKVTRFQTQNTKPGRIIRKATVERRERKRTERPINKGRPKRPTRETR